MLGRDGESSGSEHTNGPNTPNHGHVGPGSQGLMVSGTQKYNCVGTWAVGELWPAGFALSFLSDFSSVGQFVPRCSLVKRMI